MLRKILYIALIAAVTGGGYGYYLWNKAPEKTADKKMDMTISAADLATQYEDAKFLGKMIEVKGKITEVKTENGMTNIALETADPMTAISCEMEKGTTLSAVKEGDIVTVRGQCDGKLSDIALSRCILK